MTILGKTEAKGGGGSIVVWGMFSEAGVRPLIKIHGRVNAIVYQNLLQQHALPSLQASPSQPPILMQDNVPVTLQN